MTPYTISIPCFLEQCPFLVYLDTTRNNLAGLIGGTAAAVGFGLIAVIALAVLLHRNKVANPYKIGDEDMGISNACFQEDDTIEQEDSL